ncbi:hypothetical protein DL766_006768 [Monosporascus sp. MC13-8B]|uniref:Uncharacterized protein n=1 Tax=Monosporascus cannonballus TaxID=155416 RepID=A0ABY0HD02_9PEZI|nr:hypothetical protein DL762_002607 [Monosporascus cannonballus]RYP01567.1 hypothetical protein DL763_000098 [Monosporascus cannonballus]RYP26315.1 hypothetical protein DL766_006768 [Monosporascus sp. MC13-8B]
MADNNMDVAREGHLGEDGETQQQIAMRRLAAGDKATWSMDTVAGPAQLCFSNAVFRADVFMLLAFGLESAQAAAAATTNNNNKAQIVE